MIKAILLGGVAFCCLNLRFSMISNILKYVPQNHIKKKKKTK